jgi:hypothetical protein
VTKGKSGWRTHVRLPPQFKIGFAPDNSPEYQEKYRQVREYRKRIAPWLTYVADRAPMNQRSWFRISEIVEHCSRIPGSVGLDQKKYDRAIELLRKAIFSGEFDDANERSKVANLYHAFAVDLRFGRDSAADPEYFRQWISYLWIRRADCEAWFKRNRIAFPEDWGAAPSSTLKKREETKLPDDSVTAPSSDPKKQSYGRKSRFSVTIRRIVFRLMEFHGDLSDDDPEWSMQADVERAVRVELGDHAPRAESTIRRYVAKFIAEWKELKATEG